MFTHLRPTARTKRNHQAASSPSSSHLPSATRSWACCSRCRRRKTAAAASSSSSSSSSSCRSTPGYLDAWSQQPASRVCRRRLGEGQSCLTSLQQSNPPTPHLPSPLTTTPHPPTPPPTPLTPTPPPLNTPPGPRLSAPTWSPAPLSAPPSSPGPRPCSSPTRQSAPDWAAPATSTAARPRCWRPARSGLRSLRQRCWRACPRCRGA
jgi:hypothetical protein